MSSGFDHDFQRTYCSQCGGEFGPGDSGFSHCSDHQPANNEGQHGAEDAADTAARLALVQEIDALRLMATWAYSKLHSRTFNSMDDALELDRLKLWCEHGVVA